MDESLHRLYTARPLKHIAQRGHRRLPGVGGSEHRAHFVAAQPRLGEGGQPSEAVYPEPTLEVILGGEHLAARD